MKAETRFPRTVEAYKAHLHEDRPHYDSFQTFCRKQGVRYKGVMQWMQKESFPILVPKSEGFVRGILQAEHVFVIS